MEEGGDSIGNPGISASLSVCTCSFKASRILDESGSPVTLWSRHSSLQRTESTREFWLSADPSGEHQDIGTRFSSHCDCLVSRPSASALLFFPRTRGRILWTFPCGNGPGLVSSRSPPAIPSHFYPPCFFLQLLRSSPSFLCFQNLFANHRPVSVRNSSSFLRLSFSLRHLRRHSSGSNQPRAASRDSSHRSIYPFFFFFFNVNRQNGQGDQVLRSAWRMHPPCQTLL